MKATWRTRPIDAGECETCRATFPQRNAMALAAQHFERNPGHTVRVERTRAYYWQPAGDRLANRDGEQLEQAALV